MENSTSVKAKPPLCSQQDGPGPSAVLYARRLVKLQFEARLPPRSRHFRWPAESALLCIQDQLYEDLFQRRRFSSTATYRKLFLRELCSRLEVAVADECDRLRAIGVDEIEFPEVNADLLEHYAELLASGTGSVVGTAQGSVPESEFTTHHWPDDRAAAAVASAKSSRAPWDVTDLLEGFHAVTVREEGSAISKGTTGLRTWEASLRLAGHLIANPDLITSAGTRILELGSGAGFLGSVCAIQQGRSEISSSNKTMGRSSAKPSTWLSDVPGQVLGRIRDTLELNGLAGASHVHVQELDWLELQAERRQSEQRDDLPSVAFLRDVRPTLVLAADVVYDPDLVGPLAEAIQASLEAAGRKGASRALVASTIRNSSTYGAFRAALVNRGLRASITQLHRPTLSSPHEHAPSIEVFPSAHEVETDGVVELLTITL
ncbi:hypothetical protein BCV70DRAFT_198644 [Testicularia cyperi]|uniref:FAM86 N-terminal domain-containing protein n=1 Tax=Testicularia cyperi TaxID=1882483 RepID=A0A317XWQ9_9BASI|nr:hypothetical protein BCV70DRAFT_198644 [Testicularia cyperi]